jgi:hypothetical protein
MGYAIRLPANRVLQDKIGYLLKRPVGRPSHEVRRYYASCLGAVNWPIRPSGTPARRGLSLPKTPNGVTIQYNKPESGGCRLTLSPTEHRQPIAFTQK